MTIVLELPFTGSWLVQNSPAERVPSHGTDRLGSRYAIDFVAVDERHRSASRRTWRTLLASEPQNCSTLSADRCSRRSPGGW